MLDFALEGRVINTKFGIGGLRDNAKLCNGAARAKFLTGGLRNNSECGTWGSRGSAQLRTRPAPSGPNLAP